MINYTGTYTDHYELTMSQVYFLSGQKDNRAVFDFFFRRLPFDSGYAVFAGLEDLLGALERLRFDKLDLDFLKGKGFHPEFISYLEKFCFSGSIYSLHEGDIIFPLLPVLQVEANIIEAQIIETLLLNILNFQTLIATKASRMRHVAGDRILIDFGLRRAQGTGGLYASKAAFIGGFNATSNVLAGREYGIPVAGTMAHSYIESFDDELLAFASFAEAQPDDCVFLVDTYDTLRSGLPNAVKVAKKMEEKGKHLSGIRIDSGDLAFLTRECRRILDSEGLSYVKISVSNKLDEYIIKSLLEQEAPVDIFGVGTNLVTGFPDAALDGVYKLAFSGNKPRIKLSENTEKITLPHKKQVFRILDNNGRFEGADAVTMADENDVEIMYHPLYPFKSLNVKGKDKERLLHPVMENGVRVSVPVLLKDIVRYRDERLKRLPEEYKRFDYPHVYKVGLSSRLMNERDRLIKECKLKYESTGNS
jgi:nicotinate phosphoribosyltransferase